MDNSMSVNQLLSQIRTIREQTSIAPGGNIGRVDVGQVEGATPRVDFSQLLGQSIDAVNATQQRAGELSAAYSSGDKNVSLTEVMVNMQKADVSFKALVEVRNKFVDAYQEVMRMSI